MELSNKNSRTDLHLIVYEGRFGLVQEKRALNSLTGNQIQINDLPSTVDVTSIQIQGVNARDWTIIPPTGLNETAILQELIGEVVMFEPTDKKKERYRLISADPDLILEELSSNEVLLNPAGEISVLSVPESIQTSPSIIVTNIEKEWSKILQLTYLIDGIAWESFYITMLDGSKMKIQGFIKITNQTGTSFENISLQTMAGETKRIREPQPYLADAQPKMMMSMEESSSYEVTEETEGELHLYTIPFKTSLKDGQSTVIPFFQDELPYRLFYAASPREEHPITTIEWTHQNEMPLAKGKMTFYYKSDSGVLFAGEDHLPYTANQKEVQLELGRAVDIDSEHEVLRSYISGEDTIEDHVFRLTNRKDHEVDMIIIYPIYHRAWELIDASEEIVLKTANELQLGTSLKAGESKIVTFSIKLLKTNKR